MKKLFSLLLLSVFALATIPAYAASAGAQVIPTVTVGAAPLVPPPEQFALDRVRSQTGHIVLAAADKPAAKAKAPTAKAKHAAKATEKVKKAKKAPAAKATPAAPPAVPTTAKK